MDNITGPPVTGENFYGRQNELDYAWERIRTGNNLNLPAPRRVGKTSFALKLIDKAKSEGWSTVCINLEKVSTEHDFIELFIDQMKQLSWWQKAKDKGNILVDLLKQFKPSVNIGGATLEIEWQSNKKNVYKQLADLLDHSEKTLIFFDEVTVLLNSILTNGPDGKKNVTDFLHWLRDARITASSKIRWVYCNSAGIENFTHRHGISDTINDIHDYKLQSYSKAESIEMLQILSKSKRLQIDDEVLQAIVDKLEYCLPFFLQIIFEKIHYLAFVEKMPINEAIVETAYLALIEEKHFNTWIERLKEQYGADEKYALPVLKHLCQAKKGVKRANLVNAVKAINLNADSADEIVSRLLYMLKNDGYIIDEKDLYHFRSPLLRDFWFNRFVK